MIGNIQIVEGNLQEILLASPIPLLKFIARLVGTFGVFNCILMTLFFIGFVIWVYNRSASSERQYLIDKYGNTDIFERIAKGSIWIGQTAEQLRDARGMPVDVDETVTREMISQTWKYQRRGQNRYAIRVFLENDIVVGWKTSNE